MWKNSIRNENRLKDQTKFDLIETTVFISIRTMAKKTD